MEIDKSTCWYSNDCAPEMNKALQAQRRDMPIVPHLEILRQNISFINDSARTVIDIGCGTGSSSPLFNKFIYTGLDLSHILDASARVNFPQYTYIDADIVQDDLNIIRNYDVILLNGLIDVMQYPLIILERILIEAKDYVLLHRQEIVKDKATEVVRRTSYNSTTFHSLINRSAFDDLLKKHGFFIVKELNCDFGNWEDGGHSFLLKKKTWALNDLDRKLDEIFCRKTNGIFIEAGAVDGILQSNTMFFEAYRNWTGILIEPITPNYAQCKKNRPKCIVENYALVENDFNRSKTTMLFPPECHGLMSAMNNNKGVKHVQKTGELPAKIIVPCTTLNTILEKNNISKIDFFSLDVEGYELQVLKGIDLNKYKIEWILTEQLEEQNNEIERYLKEWYNLHSILSDHDFLYARIC